MAYFFFSSVSVRAHHQLSVWERRVGEVMSKKANYEIAISGCGEGNLVMKGNRCIRQITAVIFKSVIFLPKTVARVTA